MDTQVKAPQSVVILLNGFGERTLILREWRLTDPWTWTRTASEPLAPHPTAFASNEPDHTALYREDGRVNDAVQHECPACNEQSGACEPHLSPQPLQGPHKKERAGGGCSIGAREHHAKTHGHDAERRVVRDEQYEKLRYLLHPCRSVMLRISIFLGEP